MTRQEPVYFFLTIKDGQLVAEYAAANAEGKNEKLTRVFTDDVDLQKFFVEREEAAKPLDITVMCSSSLDFPEEYTADQRVVDLCNYLRAEPDDDWGPDDIGLEPPTA